MHSPAPEIQEGNLTTTYSEVNITQGQWGSPRNLHRHRIHGFQPRQPRPQVPQVLALTFRQKEQRIRLREEGGSTHIGPLLHTVSPSLAA